MAIKPFNSIGGFSVGDDPVITVIQADGTITTVDGTFTGNLVAGNVLTDALLYANGDPWDFQQPAGQTYYVQYNYLGNFGADANFQYNPYISTLELVGTANVSNLNVASDVSIAGNVEVDGFISATGNITTAGYYFGNGKYLSGLQTDRISNGSSNVAIPVVNGNVNVGVNGIANVAVFNVDGVVIGGNGYITGNSGINEIQLDYNAISGLVGLYQISVIGDKAVAITNDGTNAKGDFGTPSKYFGNIYANGLNTTIITSTGNIDTGGNLSVTGNVQVGNNVSVVGNINTSNSITAVGNIITSSNVSAAGNGSFANVNTPNIFGPDLTLTATTGNITLSAAGNVYVNQVNIKGLAEPVQAYDAATKYYVDTQVSSGIDIHTAVQLDLDTNVIATYTDGGTTPEWTTITTGNTLTTTLPHGLATNDVIVFDNTSNGLTAGVPYFVCAVPSTTSITLSLTYGGIEYDGLVDGTGLTIDCLVNSGVGATLVGTSNGYLIGEGYTAQVGDRALFINQTDQRQNGVYVITDEGLPGSGGRPWAAVRASDADKFGRNSPLYLDTGAYFLVTDGTDQGESYVLNSVGTIVFGTTNITFAEFSQITPYTAGTGLTLNNFEFSISNTSVTAGSYGDGGNIAVFTVNHQGQLTSASNVVSTPNAANLTGNTLASGVVNSSLTAVGVLANLSVSGNANIGNIGTAGIITAGGNIQTSSNLSVIGNANIGNIGTSGIVSAAGNGYFSNVSASGNLIVVNISASGNVSAVGNVIGGNLLTGGEISAGGNSTVTGNLFVTTNASVSGNLYVANVVQIANSFIAAGNSTTTSIGANQTIASFAISGTTITGVEFIVKGHDAAGGKYSLEKVLAVTNGAAVNYTTYGTTAITSYTGLLAVNIISGGATSNIALQVTPASSNTTTWYTQYRLI